MPNMSYCRFENTLRDLRDCEAALRDGEAEDSELSREEQLAKRKLIRLCIEVAKEYGPDPVGNALNALALKDLLPR